MNYPFNKSLVDVSLWVVINNELIIMGPLK